MDDDEVMFAIYNLNGIIVRGYTQEDARFAEIVMSLDSVRDFADRILVAVAATYIALTADRHIDFVFSDHTLQRFVVRLDAFDRDARVALAETLVGIRKRMGLLRRLADEKFYVDGNGGPLVTGSDPELERYRVTDGIGRAFVEAFAGEYRAAVARDA